MTKQEEKNVEDKLKEYGKKVQLDGLRTGAKGILGAVLNMCNEGKTVEEIKKFCEDSLGMDGMKRKRG